MLKITCGTDIIEVDRVEKSIENTNGRFIKEVFTEKEIAYCENKGKSKYQHYAARFAAKEATFKAISIFLENKYDISWQNVQIINNDTGKPHIEFIGIKLNQIKSIDISISHIKQCAIANVVLVYEQ